MHGKLENPKGSTASDITTRKLTLTIISDKTGASMKEADFTLPEWGNHILEANADSKVELLWLKGALFGNVKSDKGSYRTNANVRLITAIVVEYDTPRNSVETAITFHEAMAIVKKAGVRALIYTSPSHKEGDPRWRIILPLSYRADPARHEVLVAIINGLFNGQLAPESFVLSQSYYFGSVHNNPDHRVEIVDGDFLDLRDDLFAKRIYKDGGSMPRIELSQSKSKHHSARSDFENGNPYRPADKDEVKFALNQFSSDDYLVWMKVGAALADEFDVDGFELFEPWSKKSRKYNVDFCKVKWADFSAMTEYSMGTLFHLATKANPNWREEWRKAAAGDAGDGDSDIKGDDEEAGKLFDKNDYGAPSFSEESIALVFAERHTEGLRYVAKWGGWLQWDGARWVMDETVLAFDLARKICREAASKCNKLKDAKVIASAKTVAAVERLAKADRRLATTTEQFDSEAYYFNEGG